MIDLDHAYILIAVNFKQQIAMDVYCHRVNAIFAAAAMAEKILGSDYLNLEIMDEVRKTGLDLVMKAQKGPAYISLTRRVPK